MTDDGWASRKLWLALLTMALIYIAWERCGRPQSLFGELCAAEIAAATIYKGSNAIDTWLKNRKAS